ncbi:LysR family transcriptional regulator [Endozoicomonas lisbonensis]|uniref:LysR family glycine cleavage system transcriptional activator n=1 Tax=Endozoicomonas lisbonensis TaxID=3120522 RepID=A0ABV2SI68_9GAMM
MRRLPPLNAVHYFEITASCGSIREAARELCISPSAVSHQIAKLEQFLDCALFHRVNGRLLLSDAGKKYLGHVKRAFSQIESATWDAYENRKSEQLVIASPPSFSSLWLLPNLSDFLRDTPQLNIKLIDKLTIADCENDVDCGIEYRFNTVHDRFSEKLFNDDIVPLASPGMVKSCRLDSMDRLRGLTLIVTERRFFSWKAILSQYNWLDTCRVISVKYTHQALSAAVHGHGVALANRHNSEELVRKGHLQIPFSIDFDRSKAPSYYFSCKNKDIYTPKVNQFYLWLKNTLKAR